LRILFPRVSIQYPTRKKEKCNKGGDKWGKEIELQEFNYLVQQNYSNMQKSDGKCNPRLICFCFEGGGGATETTGLESEGGGKITSPNYPEVEKRIN